MRLPTVATVLALMGLLLSVQAAFAQQDAPLEVSPGFAHLMDRAPDITGSPIASERPGDVEGSTIVPTTTGMLYWQPGINPSWTDGFSRLTLDRGDAPIEWASPAELAPPAPVRFVPSVMSAADYIRSHSRYGSRAVCVSNIETGGWTAFYNKIPWGGGQHAHGYFGWLDSTWNGWLDPRHKEWGTVGLGGSIMNLDDEIVGFDRMLDARRGREFAGILWGRC